MNDCRYVTPEECKQMEKATRELDAEIAAALEKNPTIEEAAQQGIKAQFATDTDLDEKSNREHNELRLYCVMRADLEAPIGKLMAQAGHAFVGCVANLESTKFQEYINSGVQSKIVLRAKNERELLKAKAVCDEAGIPFYLVTDAGRTVFPEPTVTCLGVGPIQKWQLPKFIQRLQLL